MIKTRAILVALATLAVVLLPVRDASAATVKWSDTYPSTGNVTIPAGQTVVLDTDVNLGGLTIDGTLRCGTGDVELKSRYVLVNGALRCGAASNRHSGNFTITLKGAGAGNIGGFGDKYLVARPDSTVRLHGERRTPWVRLTATAPAGTRTLQLEANDWRVGDQIAIAPTDFNHRQAEHATIVSRAGNTVTLNRPLDYMHYCGTETFGDRSVTECAEVGLLTRNITIRGDAGSATSQIGGHAMFHRGSSIRIDGVEFWRMGQIGRVGRYPVHFHLFGDASTSIFRDNSIWQSYNRWATLHGVQNLRFKNNVAYDGIGHGYYLEDGDEIGNTITGNLGILARGAEPGQLVTPSDNAAATFWIANPDNTIANNVAAGAAHSGFWYSLPERPLGTSTADLWPRQTPLGLFRGNVAHSVGFAGLMVDRGERPDRTLETTWYNPVEVPGNLDSDPVPPTFSNFTTYKSRHYGMWVRTFSGGTFNNMVFADNWRGVYLANIQTRGDETIGTIKNSLIVGETANVGQPESWEATGAGGRSLPKFWEPDAALGGVPFYDGPMHVRNTVFGNFRGNAVRQAGALTNLFPNAFWVSPANGVWNAEFVNAQPVLLPDVEEYVDGDATAVFIDQTGSVTGNRGAAVTVQGALVDNDDDCRERAQWNAMICDPSVGYASVVLSRLDGRWARADLTRNDGRTFGFDGSDERSDRVFFTLMADMRHRVSWEVGIPQQFNLYVPDTVGMAGRGARLIFPAPGGDWTFQVNGQYESAPRLSALNSGPSNWYYDAAANEIHVRITSDSDWITMR